MKPYCPGLPVDTAYLLGEVLARRRDRRAEANTLATLHVNGYPDPLATTIVAYAGLIGRRRRRRAWIGVAVLALALTLIAAIALHLADLASANPAGFTHMSGTFVTASALISATAWSVWRLWRGAL